MLFVAILRSVVIYALFRNPRAKKSAYYHYMVYIAYYYIAFYYYMVYIAYYYIAFCYYMVYIAYYTVLNLQICIYAQKQRICRENSKYALDESFYGHFCPRRRAANFCNPAFLWTFFHFKNTQTLEMPYFFSFFGLLLFSAHLQSCVRYHP